MVIKIREILELKEEMERLKKMFIYLKKQLEEKAINYSLNLQTSDEIKALVMKLFYTHEDRCFTLFRIANKYKKDKIVKNDLYKICARWFIDSLRYHPEDTKWISESSNALKQIFEKLGMEDLAKLSEKIQMINIHTAIEDYIEEDIEELTNLFFEKIPDIKEI